MYTAPTFVYCLFKAMSLKIRIQEIFIYRALCLGNVMTIARVKSKKGFRKGKGFSEEEIKKAGMTIAMAKKLKIVIDPRRKSAHDFNVAELKKLKPPEKKPKVKKAAKAAKPKAPKPEKKPVKKAKEKPKKPAKKKAAPKPKPKATKSKKK